ncbi:recombinase family protein [Rossellomorea oryzaecorticis]|uniref:Recombinase family protein n=1 Tax=Rossellomorea oryzaecorticis TaxID=1396505 RepID=A0ABU9KAW7_9BACI
MGQAHKSGSLRKSHSSKLHIFLRRVSTDNQNLEMQLAADKQYRDILDDDDYLEFNELGVSANKVKLRDRPSMVNIINLIRNGEVNTLYVYDRSRLSRNFYEYMELIDLFIACDVKVVFTTSNPGYSPFSANYLVEGINGILVEEEGIGIATRISDVNRTFPAKKFGFEVLKKNTDKFYTPKEEVAVELHNLFNTAMEIKDMESFVMMLNVYSKLLSKQPTEIVKMILDPFYAGAKRNGEAYITLSHVKPFLSLSEHKSLQDTVKPFVDKLQHNLHQHQGENVLMPICGKCKAFMKYKKSKVGNTGTYTCSNKHKKVSIETGIYNEVLVENGFVVLKCLNHEKLKQKVTKVVNDLLNETYLKLDNVLSKIEHVEVEIATISTEQLSFKNRVETLLYRLKENKMERRELKERLLLLESHKSKVSYLAKKLNVAQQLSTEKILQLAPLLVKECTVYEDTISFEFFYNEFFDKEQLERMK